MWDRNIVAFGGNALKELVFCGRIKVIGVKGECNLKLSSFSVNNYRSITTAHKIQTHNMTVLVGKNNEGKSNILRALTLAMDIMKIYADNPRALNFSPRYLRNRYDWERDYPVSLQEKRPGGSSIIDLTFELDQQEITNIRMLTNIRVTSNIPVRISINNSNAKIDIPKKGTPAFSNIENKQKIIDFVCSKIDFNFIPAVRTEQDALRVVDSLIENELATLESMPEYAEATDIINRLQQNVLNQIASHIIAPMQEFLPTVKDIQIHIQKEKRRVALRRNIEVIIDDGTPTPIQQKGDGIKSLTALAMLNIPNNENRVSVIAIEEPESHLHPESARQLYDTIVALSGNHQIVLTTHSPLFVNRTSLNENIIVSSGKATPVKRIKDIRDVLGTKVSDNLINAENILIVEGETDKIVLEKLLPQMSDKIKKSLQNGTLIIDYMGGTGNLAYKLSFYRNIQCKYHVLLDNDDAGRQAGQNAEKQGLLSVRNTTYTVCNGFPNAELEDCYESSTYAQDIFEAFGVNIKVSEFKGHEKWSDRIANCFKSQGKQWNSNMEKKVKFTVANALPLDPLQVFHPNKRSAIDALVSALNNLL